MHAKCIKIPSIDGIKRAEKFDLSFQRDQSYRNIYRIDIDINFRFVTSTRAEIILAVFFVLRVPNVGLPTLVSISSSS